MSLQRLLLGAALVLAPCAASAKPAAPPEVRTDLGPVRGLAAPGVRSFLGIPYAAPPVGERRWTPPQPAAAWSAPRAATDFGPACAQNDTFGHFAAPGREEDCLYLNVYAPARAARAPVMVWIYGGGLRAGAANDYDPAALVREGVVVVSFNYRMGVLGYFAHPALEADNASPNYGLLDQIAALEWVKRNIAAFGGDPERVTIFGESAGARSVAALLVSPRAAGLFHRAILQSVGFDGVTNPPAAAIVRGRGFAEAAGCADDAACLRALPVDRILALQKRFLIAPVTGGADLPESPHTALPAGRFNRVPVIAGWNHDEATWQASLGVLDGAAPATAEDYRKTVAAFGGARTDAVAAAYPLSAYASPGQAIAAITTDFGFVCGTRRMLRLLAPNAPAWAYEFADAAAPQYNEPAAGVAYGAAHTSELQYLFPGFHGATGAVRPLSPAQQKLALQMRRLWTGFARSGQADWPRYDAAGDSLLVLKTPASEVRGWPYNDARHCDIWDAIAPR